MSFPLNALYRIVELDVDCTSPGTLGVYTDVPEDQIDLRSTITIPITITRRRVRGNLPYNVQGFHIQLKYSPGSGTARLYGCRVWARVLPLGRWDWYPLPVVITPDDYSTVPLPIPPSPEEYRVVQLPIPPTSDDYRMFPLPIKGTPPVPDWVALPIDE